MDAGTPSIRLLRSALGAGLLLAPVSLPAPPARAEDSRSIEVLRYACGSEFGRRDVTLFANGTVRLREGSWEEQKLYLDELAPEALEDNLRLLRGIYSDNETDRIRQPLGDGLAGSWIERCEVRLALPELDEPLRYEFSAHEIPPLRVARMVHLAEELAVYARPADRAERLPDDYEPQFGDVLRTADGARYHVLRLTVDQKGVELQGVDQPVRIYVALEHLDEVFVALEERRTDAWWWRR